MEITNYEVQHTNRKLRIEYHRTKSVIEPMNHLAALLLSSSIFIAHEFSMNDKTAIINLCLSDARVAPFVDMAYLDDSGMGYVVLKENDFVSKELEQESTCRKIRVASKEDALFKSLAPLHMKVKNEKLSHCEIEISKPSKSLHVILKLKKKSGRWAIIN